MRNDFFNSLLGERAKELNDQVSLGYSSGIKS